MARQPDIAPPQVDPAGAVAPAKRGFRAFVAKYGHMLWWLHSVYALGLGIFVVLFAQKGFSYARWLAVSLAAVWVVVILFFRIYGKGSREQLAGTREKLRFYVMTYVLKNLYQGMLFFLLPFYWRSATLEADNQWFVVVLAVCAFLSTLDVIFDQVLMRWKAAASLFYFVTLFACLNLVIPSLLPNTRSLVSLIAAAVIAAVAFFSMHVSVRALGRPVLAGALVAWTAGSAAGAYFGREAVPPVSMYVSSGAVGPKLLDDGRLAIEAHVLHVSLIEQLYAVTDVVIPGGKGDRLVHVWRHDGQVVQRSTDVDRRAHGPTGTLRLRSQLAELPADASGHWTVDVVTQDGQLVGRVPFEVIN
jgi:hypothetical protein